MSCPISIGEPVTGSVVKFSRKEMSEMMRADRDWSGEARPQEGTCMCIHTTHNQDNDVIDVLLNAKWSSLYVFNHGSYLNFFWYWLSDCISTHDISAYRY